MAASAPCPIARSPVRSLLFKFDPLLSLLHNNTSIINNGTITGFVELVGGNNSFVNNGLFNLRHFADTTGGGHNRCGWP